jgi:hypothetical protein
LEVAGADDHLIKSEEVLEVADSVAGRAEEI